MKYVNRSLCLFLCIFSSALFSQQITVDNTVTAQDLIQNTLIQGCVEVSDISSPYNGSSIGLGSFGYFEKGSSNFPFENGIVLTTGNAYASGNGLNNTVLNDGDDTWTTDADLETALGISGTLNATSIEFNFVSISNQIQFNYILASEEYYGNFPCDYSDGFAFLIREAGSSDPYTNIALVPGTSTPVNTNTVHDDIIGFCEASNGEYFEGYNLGDTNYNGRTTVMSATASIQPNVQYQIKLVIADQNDENYDSAVFIEGNSFNASVNLGEDITTCATSADLNGDIQNPDATYSWYLNDVLIPSATLPDYTAVLSGTYRIEVEIPLAGSSCVIEDEVNISLSSTQTAEPIDDYVLCDDSSADGVEFFDLSTKDSEVLASVPASNYTFSYHYTSLDALNNVNPITAPIQNTSSPQTIHVRIEDIDNGCLAYSFIDLVVNPLPSITDPTPLEICSGQESSGTASIDLNSLKDDEITNGQTNLIVTYHTSASDAEAGTNAIPMPYVNTNANEQLFVSVEDPETGCNSTTSLSITILENPDINTEDLYIDACDVDHDGFASFDLTSITPDVLQGLTGVTVTFHTSEEDALSGANPIADENNYQNVDTEEQTLYVRVVSNATGCPSIASFEIHTNLLLTATNIRDVNACDEGDDGVEEFDFENISVGIINNVPDVTITYYESETDRANQVNAIDTSSPYTNLSNPQTIYITLENSTCSEDAEIELVLFPIIEFESVGNLTVCDEDQDGITTIDLTQFNDIITDGQNGFQVKYFLTEEDALNNQNAIQGSYTNESSTFTLYPRIRLPQTNCSSVNSFEVTVLPAPLGESPEEIIICDADMDGFSIVNLFNSIPNSILSTPDRNVTFYNTQEDADTAANVISNTSNYNAQTEIVYMRIENTITGCHTTEELSIIVNTLPYIGDLSNYVNEYNFCEDETDGIGEFVFELKDDEALDGQTGKEVSYYLTQADADNKVNAIDKTSVYENVSNPQQIYVRIDNISDESCYTTSSFTIEVGTNPLYNEPTDIFVCDDFSNDGSETFDLSSKIAEVSQGIPDIQNVTFYATEEDARNSTNALPTEFTNTVNPQEIYVQIDNGTICNSITSFVINVILVPEVTAPEPIVECDDDTDGVLTFDITQAETNILDVRQEDIVIDYYLTWEDSEANVNEITNPESFNNTSNPQTVFFKVTNTVSNCYITLPIELVVNQPPLINDFEVYNVCENESNTVDLSEINEIARDTNFNVLYSYFATEADAIANENALDTNYTYSSNQETLFVRTEYSTTHCSTYYEFDLVVNPLPIANQANDLIDCDDNFDGILEFDLSQQDADILGSQSSSNYTVTYHNSELQAQEANSALETNYMAFDTEVIYARVENNMTGCYDISQFSVFVNPLPVIDIEDQVICLDNLPLLVSANTNNPNDTYLWSTGQTTPEIEITEIGSYWVTVTSEFGCENTRVFGVTESESASIEVTEILDFSDPNNITVTISGIGDYLYQLDDLEPQESNVFYNVAMGYHTVTIIDLNGCSNVTKEVLVVDIPKFFTPNNDGAFDTWHIVGVETLPGTTIDIFDRYGKFIKRLTSNTPGWDGYYNGVKMPTSDYWYVANVQRNNISFEVKGHFTLRR